MAEATQAPANKKTREFSVSEWQERIRNGQRFQEKFADSKSWDTYKRYYRHSFKKGVIPVNIVFSMLRSMVPQVYFRNPKVTVTPTKPGIEADLNARIIQSLDNWLLKELMTKQEMKKIIQDTFLYGIGCGFFGYDSMFGFDLTETHPDLQSTTLTQFDKRGHRIEYHNAVNPGMPWFLRARPEDVIFPWGTESVAAAEWVALRVFRPLDDVKRDPKYTNTKDLQGSFVRNRSHPEGRTQTDDFLLSGGLETAGQRQWVEIFQIHDSRTGKIYALTMDHDKFIRNQTDEMQIDGLPVETLVFNPDSDYVYGIPDARIIEPQLLELNEIRTQAMKHRRVDIIKAIAKRGAFTDTELQKMTSEDVMAIVQADIETNLKDTIIPFSANVTGVLQDLTLMGEVVRGDVREMIGFSRIAQGEFQGKTHISAAETKAVFQSLNIRLDERRDMVADMLTNIVRKFNQMIFTYWDTERVRQVVGPDGAQWWLKFTGPQIKGEYDLTITPEEGPSLDTSTKFEMGIKAAEVWAKMNQGAIKQGQPIPSEIQRLIFSQFQSSGLDIDRLLAQSQAFSNQARQALGALGKSRQQAVSPALLAAVGGQNAPTRF